MKNITKYTLAVVIALTVSQSDLNSIGMIIRRAPEIARAGAGVIAGAGAIIWNNQREDRRDSIASNPGGYSLNPTVTKSWRPRMSVDKKTTGTGRR